MKRNSNLFPQMIWIWVKRQKKRNRLKNRQKKARICWKP